jgi:hypothetical protein
MAWLVSKPGFMAADRLIHSSHSTGGSGFQQGIVEKF